MLYIKEKKNIKVVLKVSLFPEEINLTNVLPFEKNLFFAGADGKSEIIIRKLLIVFHSYSVTLKSAESQSRSCKNTWQKETWQRRLFHLKKKVFQSIITVICTHRNFS